MFVYWNYKFQLACSTLLVVQYLFFCGVFNMCMWDWLKIDLRRMLCYFLFYFRYQNCFFAVYAVDEVYVDLGDLVWLYDGFGSGFPMQNLEENQLILKYMECKESHLMFWLLTMEKKVRKLTGVVFNKLHCVNDCMCLPIIITFLLIDWFVKFYIFSS